MFDRNNQISTYYISNWKDSKQEVMEQGTAHWLDSTQESHHAGHSITDTLVFLKGQSSHSAHYAVLCEACGAKADRSGLEQALHFSGTNLEIRLNQWH